VFIGREKTFACLVVLFAASAVSAAPTIISSGAPFISPSNAHAAASVSCDVGSDIVCDQIGELAKTIFQPPGTEDNPSASSNRYLPAVPPAIVMVLTGFLCVSLVRDRKVWVALLAGLFTIGQAGFNALPELSSRLGRKIHNTRLIEPTLLATYVLDGDYCPESFNEQTRYTGLLHHLEGIPCRTSVFSRIKETVNASDLSSVATAKEEAKQSQTSNNAFRNNCVSQHAIISPLSSLNSRYDYLVRPTRWFICFIPAFIFSCLSRGPPVS